MTNDDNVYDYLTLILQSSGLSQMVEQGVSRNLPSRKEIRLSISERISAWLTFDSESKITQSQTS